MADGQPPSQPQPAEQSQPRPSRRREKPQLSCTLCRRRKLRCDRGEPCGTCVRRGLAASCVYVRSSGQGTVTTTQPVVSSMTDRINQLERMLTSLVESNRNTTLPDTNTMSPVSSMLPPSPRRPVSRDASQSQNPRYWGQIRTESNETTYVPSTHWTVILEEITELKTMLSSDCGRTERSTSCTSATPSEITEPDVLFGGHKVVNSQEILAAIPPKSVVDRLVAGYFLDRPIVPIVLHGPTFLAEYERFWENPLGTSLVWIGLLFAVMCLVVSYRPEAVPMMSDPVAMVRVYREKIAQCLHLGKYTKGAPHSIETLLLYLHIELLRKEDAKIEPWMMLGVIVRLAFRMGYHRDASHFPHITPFEGEMRRRIWSLIVQLDILTSAQVGLPRMVRDDQADTAEPLNLLDEDLHRDIEELPPARPVAVQTEIQYTLSESKLVLTCGKITDWIGAMTSKRTNYSLAEADVARLDKQLDDTYTSLPETLRMRPMTKSLVDNADTILRRIILFLHLQEAKCLLHYRFYSLLPSLLQNQRIGNHHTSSHFKYIDAALQILQCQRILYEETQISGRLYKDRWRVSSLLRQPCFMATALLCVELEESSDDVIINTHTEEPGLVAADGDDSLNPENVQMNLDSHDKRPEIIQALHDCCLVWTYLSDTSREALKAAEAIRAVLNRVQSVDVHPTSMTDTRSILEATMNSSIVMTGSNSVAANSSTGQPTDGHIMDIQHSGNAHTTSDMAHHPELGEESQLEYDPLSPTQLNISQRLDQSEKVTRWFPKRFPFPI